MRTLQSARLRSRQDLAQGKAAPCPASKEKFRRASIEEDNKKYKTFDAYAEIACGCFTALRKRAAFTAASSRLVAAVEPLDFFGRLPK